VKDNQITIPETYQIAKGDFYRAQRLQITLFVPKGKEVKRD
jgi:phage shock protein C, pspC